MFQSSRPGDKVLHDHQDLLIHGSLHGRPVLCVSLSLSTPQFARNRNTSESGLKASSLRSKLLVMCSLIRRSRQTELLNGLCSYRVYICFGGRGVLHAVTPGKGQSVDAAHEYRLDHEKDSSLLTVLRHFRLCRVLDIVVIQDLRIPARPSVSLRNRNESLFFLVSEFHEEAYIIIFHVSTGRSASLNDQSNFSSATGSSVGSW